MNTMEKTNGEVKTAPVEQKTMPDTIDESTKGLQPKKEDTQDGKISGKELKERAKAEKAAKRAKEKQLRQGGGQGQPFVDMSGGNQPAAPATKPSKEQQNQSTAPDTHKPHHRRKSSVGAKGQRPLALRTTGEHKDTSNKPAHPAAKDRDKVALVQHLYGVPKRTSIAGAAKDVHPAILTLGLQISAYKICGSNARCLAMLVAFKAVISAYTTPHGTSLPRHLTTHLSSQIDYLVSCRPLATSQGNAIRWLKVLISAIDPSKPEDDAKADLCDDIDLFIRERIIAADTIIAASAASRINDTGDTILTFAKSSVVEQTLHLAHSQNKQFSVIVIDSYPLHEGRNLALALSDLPNITVQLSDVSQLSTLAPTATKCLLGAHAMLANGRLYSRVGIALVAMMAKDSGVPVIVLCESIKMTDRVALDSFVHNEVAPADELFPSQVPGAGDALSTAGTASGGATGGATGTKSQSSSEKTTPSTPANTAQEEKDDWKNIPNLQALNLMYDLTPADLIDLVITEYGNVPAGSVGAVPRLSGAP